MTALETLLAGLFDYAGLYPPASLGLSSAANNYLDYGRSKHAAALGRFIINIDRLSELKSVSTQTLEKFRLSVIATPASDFGALAHEISDEILIETVEIKCIDGAEIERISKQIPRELVTYFEVPLDADGLDALKSISAAGVRAKIRMGGVVPEALPSVSNVAQMLQALANLRLPFKATAGLHHPVRSNRPLTYQPQSSTGVMHGFMNLCCAATLLWFGGATADAAALLEGQNHAAWQVAPDRIQWHHESWTSDQLASMRRQFLISIGSCSFEEPIHDLESLGWL